MSRSRHLSTAATYWRLLSYVKPYWKVLTIGILAGLLVGSSLFVTLMLLPKMVGAVDRSNVVSQSVESKSSTGENLNDPKLREILSQADGVIKQFHLPAEIRGTRVTVTWPSSARVAGTWIPPSR